MTPEEREQKIIEARDHVNKAMCLVLELEGLDPKAPLTEEEALALSQEADLSDVSVGALLLEAQSKLNWMS